RLALRAGWRPAASRIKRPMCCSGVSTFSALVAPSQAIVKKIKPEMEKMDAKRFQFLTFCRPATTYAMMVGKSIAPMKVPTLYPVLVAGLDSLVGTTLAYSSARSTTTQMPSLPSAVMLASAEELSELGPRAGTACNDC